MSENQNRFYMKPPGKLQPTPDGFNWVIEGEGNGVIRWDDIESVELYKRDLITTDIVCMNIYFKAGDCFLLHEEIEGFVETIRAMNRYWQLGDDWYGRVVLPPFEPCFVTIKPFLNTVGAPKAEVRWSASKP